MAGEIKLNDVSVATESGGTVTIAPNNVTFAANHAGIKAALNASGSAPIYACRAWVNFDGTGTVAIRNSGNVSSISDNGGQGDYTINFATAMPDANYCTVGTTGYAGNGTASGFLGANRIGSNGNEAAPTTTAVRVNSVTFAGSVVDTKYINVSIFR
jgi:hypothetical protein